MKAIKMQIQKSSRWVAILLAAVVVILTSMVVANATQTITTPNAAAISYNLVGGASSAAITPVTNKPVLVMGFCMEANGVGQITLVSTEGLIDWVGLESVNAAATSGSSVSAGTHMVYIDSGHTVDIQTASSTAIKTIRVHNGTSATRSGNVTLIW